MQVDPPLGQLVPAPPGPPPTAIGTLEPPPPPPPWGRPVPERPSPWPVVAAVLVGLWAVAVTVGAQGVGWLGAQVLLATGLDQPAWAWPVVGALDALLVGVPAGLLAAIPRSAAVRAAGRAWLIGALTLGVLGLLRAIPLPHNEFYLAALAVSAALAAVLVRRLRRGADRSRVEPAPTDAPPTGHTPTDTPPTGHTPADTPPTGHTPADAPPTGRAPAGLAVAAGLALLLPWLWFGALGGLLETVLAVAAAYSAGSLAAAVLDRPLWAAYGAPLAGDRQHPVRLVLVGGLVAGVALLLLAAGIGQSGAQLAAMLVLPPAGFAAAALAARAVPVRFIVGLAAVGPLAFADPEEISLLLASGRDVPFWAAVAAGSALAIALLLGLGYGVGLARRRAPRPRRWVSVLTATAVLLAGGAVYLGLGQPGWYGEKLFVVLAEQADLGGMPPSQPGQAGRDARAREVYRRLVATAERSQAGLRRDLDRLHLNYTPYYLVNAIEVDGGPGVRAWLSRHGGVARVLLSQQIRPLPAAPAPSRGDASAPVGPQWNISLIGADRVWSQFGVDGSGIVVGSSDSGVNGGHPALAGRFRGGDDSWYDPWNGTRTPTDNGGHGTHTMATAVGGQNVGVAPGAHWVGCVNLDRNLGNPARYLDCLQFMLAPFPAGGNPFTDGRPERAPQILTNSWGCSRIEGCDASALRPAAAALAAAGIFFVAAAGNTGPFCGSVDDPPAPYADVLTVGAVDRERRVTDFSSRGPAAGGAVKPDVVAPGAEVLSAMPGGGYATLDGTSMATPHVAGVVALMWSANPALIGDLDRTRRILRDTAAPADLTHRPADRCGQDANIAGAGLVDAYAAVRAARQS